MGGSVLGSFAHPTYAIPLSVLSKLRNFLWLGSSEGGTT